MVLKGKAKVVQTECNGKGKAEGFFFSLLRCSLLYAKVVQTESNGKGKAEGFSFALLRCSLLYAKVLLFLVWQRGGEG